MINDASSRVSHGFYAGEAITQVIDVTSLSESEISCHLVKRLIDVDPAAHAKLRLHS
ncbi:hypothetical protein RLEG12_25895 [Rhizobium leguminosarum bv. trifolii CB782]|nr:hypothetical protein RLEG12_25895 [Rhizobium leguminosarum bv. trifolii CB782]